MLHAFRRRLLPVLLVLVPSLLLIFWSGERLSTGAEILWDEARFALVEAAVHSNLPDGYALPDAVRTTLRERQAEVARLIAETPRGRVIDEYNAGKSRHKLLPYMRPLAESALVLALIGLVCGAATLSALVIAGRISLGSRKALYTCFRWGSRLLPLALAGTFVPVLCAICCMGLYELGRCYLAAIPNFENVGVIVLSLLLMLLLCAGLLVYRLIRHLQNAFHAEPSTPEGIAVSRGEAPELWELVDDVARLCGLPLPDTIVLGLGNSFFVTMGGSAAGTATENGGIIVHLSMPFMVVLEKEELRFIVGHELAHIQGEDIEYRHRFSALYLAVEATGEALARDANWSWVQEFSFRPALYALNMFLETFHQADMHWSRNREFAADQKGALASGSQAAALALARIHLYDAFLCGVANEHTKAHSALGVLAALAGEAANFQPEPLAEYMQKEQPHPFDTHPSLSARLNNLAIQRLDDIERLARAVRPGFLLHELALD